MIKIVPTPKKRAHPSNSMTKKFGLLDAFKQLKPFFFVKINPNKPARTVLKSARYNGFGYYHWSENRSLSIEEIKAICSFPESFILTGTPNEQKERLGNSVMPNMMKVIASNIKDIMNWK